MPNIIHMTILFVTKCWYHLVNETLISMNIPFTSNSLVLWNGIYGSNHMLQAVIFLLFCCDQVLIRVAPKHRKFSTEISPGFLKFHLARIARIPVLSGHEYVTVRKSKQTIEIFDFQIRHNTQIHIFADASTQAYDSVLYLSFPISR